MSISVPHPFFVSYLVSQWQLSPVERRGAHHISSILDWLVVPSICDAIAVGRARGAAGVEARGAAGGAAVGTAWGAVGDAWLCLLLAAVSCLHFIDALRFYST